MGGGGVHYSVGGYYFGKYGKIKKLNQNKAFLTSNLMSAICAVEKRNIYRINLKLQEEQFFSHKKTHVPRLSKESLAHTISQALRDNRQTHSDSGH